MCSIEIEFHGVYSWMVEMIFIKKKQSKNKGKITEKMKKKERKGGKEERMQGTKEERERRKTKRRNKGRDK